MSTGDFILCSSNLFSPKLQSFHSYLINGDRDWCSIMQRQLPWLWFSALFWICFLLIFSGLNQVIFRGIFGVEYAMWNSKHFLSIIAILLSLVILCARCNGLSHRYSVFLLSFFMLKGVVHPQNDFLSIDYSCLRQLSSIVFVCICHIPKIEKWF